jgi:hypothetical protein
VVDIEFRVISVPEDSNEFQKTRSWKERSVEDRVTLGPTARCDKNVLHCATSWEQLLLSNF